jgi:hypothetical protein
MAEDHEKAIGNDQNTQVPAPVKKEELTDTDVEKVSGGATDVSSTISGHITCGS